MLLLRAQGDCVDILHAWIGVDKIVLALFLLRCGPCKISRLSASTSTVVLELLFQLVQPSESAILLDLASIRSIPEVGHVVVPMNEDLPFDCFLASRHLFFFLSDCLKSLRVHWWKSRPLLAHMWHLIIDLSLGQ